MHSFLTHLITGTVCFGIGLLWGSRIKSAAMKELQQLRNSAAAAIKGKG